MFVFRSLTWSGCAPRLTSSRKVMSGVSFWRSSALKWPRASSTGFWSSAILWSWAIFFGLTIIPSTRLGS